MFKSQKIIIVSLLTLLIPCVFAIAVGPKDDTDEVIVSEPTTMIDISEIATTKTVTEVTTELITEETSADLYSESDIELLARICMAEAEGQCEYGKRLVIDCVLNRKDSDEFPDSIRGVIFQKGQFSPITNGRWDRCYAQEEFINLVIEEIANRTNSSILYFNEGYYPSWASPVCHVGNHYFSK